MRYQTFFSFLLLFLLIINSKHLFAQVQGCLYKYNSGDHRIFTTPKGDVTYTDNGTTITAPGYVGSVAGAPYSVTVYENEQCVSPSPSARASYTSNCVIDDTGGSNIKYPGYLVNYAINCDLDNFSWFAVIIFAMYSARIIRRRRITC